MFEMMMSPCYRARDEGKVVLGIRHIEDSLSTDMRGVYLWKTQLGSSVPCFRPDHEPGAAVIFLYWHACP